MEKFPKETNYCISVKRGGDTEFRGGMYWPASDCRGSWGWSPPAPSWGSPGRGSRASSPPSATHTNIRSKKLHTLPASRQCRIYNYMVRGFVSLGIFLASNSFQPLLLRFSHRRERDRAGIGVGGENAKKFGGEGVHGRAGRFCGWGHEDQVSDRLNYSPLAGQPARDLHIAMI